MQSLGVALPSIVHSHTCLLSWCRRGFTYEIAKDGCVESVG